jgi:uncharacterized membrane protein
MATTPNRARGALHWFRELYPGWRLFICVVLGAGLFLALPGAWPTPMQAAIGWIAAASAFCALTVVSLVGCTPKQLRARARRQDTDPSVILILIIVACSASLIAVTMLLHKQDGETLAHLAARVALVAGVVGASWFMTHTVFALHYAHRFYGDGPEPGDDDDAGGLSFPKGTPLPDLADFLYFSLVIGMTCQVSDVQVTGRQMRRLVAMHGVLSFFYNTVILALTINLVVNAI